MTRRLIAFNGAVFGGTRKSMVGHCVDSGRGASMGPCLEEHGNATAEDRAKTAELASMGTCLEEHGNCLTNYQRT